MCDMDMGIFDLLLMGKKLVGHKLEQYLLGTNETEVISTNSGRVRGLKRRTINEEHGHYYAFEGIPYAKPPTGELRFRAPQPADTWEHIRDCTYTRDKPVQKSYVMNRIEGSEDCLYVNVYAKTLKSTKPLPVMIWIYGGGFEKGEATRDVYAPDYFMQKEIVLVSFNYRLGALGFLSLQDPDLQVPGNAALKDQLMALRWIKANIQYFNGDAENITLFGNSAGAASTHYMMITEQAKDLFHKAILQSGSVLCPWACEQLDNLAYRLAQTLGYGGTKNEKEIFRFLSKMDAHKICAAEKRIFSTAEKRNFNVLAFVPVVEPYLTDECILPKHPKDMLPHAWSNEMPIMIGGTSFEGLFAYQFAKKDPQMLDTLGECESLVPAAAKANRNQNDIREMALKLRLTYFSYREPSFKNSFYQFLDYFSYYFFWHGIYRTLLARQHYASKAATYFYRFDFDSLHFNQVRLLMCGKAQRGTAHADDLSYLFYSIMATRLAKDSAEYQTINRMIDMWTTFAATSNPNCEQIKSTEWSAVQNKENAAPKCLNISKNTKLIDLPEWEKLKIWNSLYDKDQLY